MIAQPFFERYLEIQFQILDNKIHAIKERVKDIKSDMVRDYRIKSLILERKKNQMMREYKKAKETKIRSYESFVANLNSELQDLCKHYNNLFQQLESNK